MRKKAEGVSKSLGVLLPVNHCGYIRAKGRKRDKEKSNEINDDELMERRRQKER